MEDSRVTDARLLAETLRDLDDVDYAEKIEALITYAEGRLQINVGLIAENSALKQKVGAPPTLDLSAIPSADLLAELARRLEDRQ